MNWTINLGTVHRQNLPDYPRYNRSRSDWFDATIFCDWFENTFIPHAKTLSGKVVLIGDNLSSHFSPEVLRLSKENDIIFICIPKNATHTCQPLDVAFYSPLKKYWRGILDKWKSRNSKRSQTITITKEAFPRLLNKLFENVCDTENSNVSLNLVAGFKKFGIVPFNSNEVVPRLPDSTSNQMEAVSPIVSQCVVEMLVQMITLFLLPFGVPFSPCFIWWEIISFLPLNWLKNWQN